VRIPVLPFALQFGGRHPEHHGEYRLVTGLGVRNQQNRVIAHRTGTIDVADCLLPVLTRPLGPMLPRSNFKMCRSLTEGRRENHPISYVTRCILFKISRRPVVFDIRSFGGRPAINPLGEERVNMEVWWAAE